MNQSITPRLIKISPDRVKVKESFLRPTWWDSLAVEEDLTTYISLSRSVPGTPALQEHNKELVVISGLPFLRAAQQAIPPLQEIICRLDADDDAFRQLRVKEVKPGKLLDEYPPDKVFDAVQLLSFTRSLDAVEKQAVEESITDFFTNVTNDLSYGGKYSSLTTFSWSATDTRVVWTWKCSTEEGKHKLYLIEALKKLDADIAQIKSWNGLAFTFRDSTSV